ncbi:hypothetical protein Lser_V15G07342 [Lactuca serriola]
MGLDAGLDALKETMCIGQNRKAVEAKFDKKAGDAYHESPELHKAIHRLSQVIQRTLNGGSTHESDSHKVMMQNHNQIHAGLHQTLVEGPSAASSSDIKDNAKEKKKSDLKYDVSGWATLAVGLVAWTVTVPALSR